MASQALPDRCLPKESGSMAAAALPEDVAMLLHREQDALRRTLAELLAEERRVFEAHAACQERVIQEEVLQVHRDTSCAMQPLASVMAVVARSDDASTGLDTTKVAEKVVQSVVAEASDGRQVVLAPTASDAYKRERRSENPL